MKSIGGIDMTGLEAQELMNKIQYLLVVADNGYEPDRAEVYHLCGELAEGGYQELAGHYMDRFAPQSER